MGEKNKLLDSPIQFIRGVGPKLSKVLEKKGISKVEDALYFLPRKYEDRRLLIPFNKLVPDRTATVFGKVVYAAHAGVGRRRKFQVTLSDGKGRLKLFWFHAYPSIEADFAVDTQIVAHGEVKFFDGFPQMVHPEYEVVHETEGGKPRVSVNFGRVVPIYSETEGLFQKKLRSIMGEVIRNSLGELTDPLPEEMRERLGLPSLRESFSLVHFPQSLPAADTLSPSVRRIVFEEFFVLQLGLGLRKKEKSHRRSPRLLDAENKVNDLLSKLPFQLTEDQKSAIETIKKDLEKETPMSRLLQGDVGSGKTVVAITAAVQAISAGYQVAFMAPTEILAQQHMKTASQFLEPLGIKPTLVAHGAKQKDLEGASFLVGTHALFQKKIKIPKLGLVIVDEQHRFGVEQRAELLRKAEKLVPHLLLMTATPIPRTLSLTLYGDLDLTVIRQKPAGRKKIETHILLDRDRLRLYQTIRNRIQMGQQVYVIYPLIEVSEKLDLKSATEMFDRLRREIFPSFRVALLHGRMKSAEKDSILQDFKDRKFDILVSTTVIEVGIDIPNATLMVIEHPERLGLSQLHQLRGRVGRGEAASECLLVADKFITPRLKVMERSDDGFEIAEADLKIRGPGEFLGTRQHGLPGFRVGHILRDAQLLDLAHDEAERVLTEDPELATPKYQSIRMMVESRWKEKIERLRGG